MRIGYFGGSFDPPHRGHLALARAARDAFRLDRVLFAPTGFQPLKPDGAVAAYSDRLEMVSLLSEGTPGFEVSQLEAPRADGQANFTVDALALLRPEMGPFDSLFVLVGADAFLTLRQWRESDHLLNMAQWIVLARPGFALGQTDSLQLKPQQRAHVHFMAGVDDPVSATELRERLRIGEDCSELLPAAVLAYIQERHLYGAQ